MPVTVDPETVTWRLPDPDRRLTGVRLWTDFDLGDTTFSHRAGAWELTVLRADLPAVDRLEYLFDTGRSMITDPGNPLRVGGAFGDHSWVGFDYRPPAWLEVEPTPGTRDDLRSGEIDVQVWSPVGVTGELPLLLSHDGPEMDTLGELTRFIGAMITSERLPPIRVGLLSPGRDRDQRYAANPTYASALVERVLPAIMDRVPTTGRPVIMGQSLGAVAALHAEWTHPGTFAGLLLESGSFFTAELDPQESGYRHWGPVTDFVSTLHSASVPPSTPPVAIGFGTAEENAANNRRLVRTLSGLGSAVITAEVRDGHCYTCWRDLLDPLLVDLLRST